MDFLAEGSYVAVAADKSSVDTVWFIRIDDNDCVSPDCKDSYDNYIAEGVHYLKGRFLEVIDENESRKLYKLSDLKTFFYKESVVYPYVNIEETRKGLVLKNKDLVDIIQYVEANNFSHLWERSDGTLLMFCFGFKMFPVLEIC